MNRKRKTKRVTADTPVETVDASEEELADLCTRATQNNLSEADVKLLSKVISAYLFLLRLVRARGSTINRLRRLFGLKSSERFADVLGNLTPSTKDTKGDSGDGNASGGAGAGSSSPPVEPSSESESGSCGENSKASSETTAASDKTKPNKKGNGRNGADAYRGARQCWVNHETLSPGDTCPECGKGKLYQLKKPKVIVRVVGQPPIDAEVTRLARLRCASCQAVFVASPPDGIDPNGNKYDATATAMIVLIHYPYGMPFYRLQRMQGHLQLPLPDATQWDLVDQAAQPIQPVWEQLILEAAQGSIFHNDDTTSRILEFMGKRRDKLCAKNELNRPDRTGIFTTGIISRTKGREIVLFFSGRKHAGENLNDLLTQRATNLQVPLQMCDALSHNRPKDCETLLALCICHARRGVVDQVENYPTECLHLLTEFGKVFKNDKICRTKRISDEERLVFHQTHSQPVMEGIKLWIENLQQGNTIEPNSDFGKNLVYIIKHWQGLTTFLRVSGAPLSNNAVERLLKRMVRYRKNSLFFKTQNGADTADLYMSLIATAEFANENPFHYLVALIEYADLLAASPGDWLPWSYRKTLVRLGLRLPIRDSNPVEFGTGPPVPLSPVPNLAQPADFDSLCQPHH